jgi:hypothetical protein
MTGLPATARKAGSDRGRGGIVPEGRTRAGPGGRADPGERSNSQLIETVRASNQFFVQEKYLNITRHVNTLLARELLLRAAHD